METAFIEQYPQNKKSEISIRPYFDAQIENMGLEKYGLSVFDNAFQEESIAYIEQNGVGRFVTGLNEFAPEVKALSEEEREAKIKQIRIVVAQLEKELASNYIKPDEEDFWNKVILLKPNNIDFWDKIKIRVGNEPVFLEPDKDPYDLIKLYALEAGGFSLVAKSLDHVRTMNNPTRFYLDKLEDTASTKTEIKKMRNKALSELEKLSNKNQGKLLYIAKILDPNSTQYKKTTPTDILYLNMDAYINGDLTERDKRKSAERFLEAANLDMEALKIKAILKDATEYKMIAHKSDGFIYDLASSTMMGRNLSDGFEFLKNPLNEAVLVDLTKKLERYWLL